MRILCDVDGVIADFVSAACHSHGQHVPNPYPPGEWDLPKIMGLSEADFWKPLDNASFWRDDVLTYVGADAFVKSLRSSGEVIFTTIPSKASEATTAKIVWLRRRFGQDSKIVVCDNVCKSVMANAQTVLIDDNDKNIEAFQKAGGHTITFPRPWNKRHAECKGTDDSRYELVLAELQHIIEATVDGLMEELLGKPTGEHYVTDPTTGGRKGTKVARYDLIPPDVLWELAEHYGKNCKEHGGRYDARNWERGYPWSLSYAAMMRHGAAFWNGEDLDPEQKSKHIIAAAWHCLALAWFMDHYREGDDRANAPRQVSTRSGDNLQAEVRQ